MQTEYEYDVFISYSSHDEAWVTETLLPRLENAGLNVCIHFRDFTPGRAALLNMQDAVRKSRHTLLVLSPNWFASEWTLYESILVGTKDPAGLKPRTIPLLLQECEFPEEADFIAVLTYIDFTKPKHLDLAWRQLLTALGKPLEPEPPKEPQPDQWFLAHPYPMPPNFTGRLTERAMLSRWLDADAAHPLLSLRALGGFGKSALAWHWLTHDVAPAAWPRVVWWSFYEGDASFDHFLAETLDYLSGGKIKPDSLSAKDAVKTLLEMLHPPGTLLVLDGFERLLRAFGGLDAAYQGDEAKPEVRSAKSEGNDRDCISPLAEMFLLNVALQPDLGSKVLLTTRLCPRVLEAKGGGFLQGCREEELREMQPADAVEFFRAQGIRGTHTEIEQACGPYGYHPLSLRLLAGLIVGDLQQPGDIAAAKRLDVSGDLVHRQHHVLEMAYNSLTPTRQALLGRIACFRSPVKYDALKALAKTEDPLPSEGRGPGAGWLRRLTAALSGRRLTPSLSPSGGEGARRAGEGSLDADLRDLVARGLLHHDTKEGRFNLHPIVRRYAYDRLAAPDRAAAHTRLRDYFAAVPKPDKVMRLEDLAPVIEFYHHTVRAGQFGEAFALYRDRLANPIYFQLGAYQLQIDLLRALFPEGEDRPPRLKDERHQASTLNDLACVYALIGQPRCAAPLFEADISILERLELKRTLPSPLVNLAQVQIPIGALRAAEANMRRSIALCRENKDEFGEAVGHEELGRLLAYRGDWNHSEQVHQRGISLAKKLGNQQIECVIIAYSAHRSLLRGSTESALAQAKTARELADIPFPGIGKLPRDIVRADWLLGAAHRVGGQYDEAERHLHEALQRCRRINMVDHEADILIDLARLRAATHSAGSGQAGAPDEARRLAEEALLITERSGYVLQGADAHLELARLALARGDKAAALEHAKEARRLATCDGPPDYTYKVAYDEAGALLAQLKDA